MFSTSRREFFAASAAGLASSLQAGPLSAQVAEDISYQPETLFLTWHSDPTTTMTIQWLGVRGELSDTKIYYLPMAAPKNAPWAVQSTAMLPYPMSDLKVFRSELLGLTPNTEYQFRIGKQGPAYKFRTMPAKATDTIHFVSGGDCGTNIHTVANNMQAARQDPMFTVIGGDLGYDNGRSVATSLAFLRNYSKHMVGKNGRLIPMLACLGNHEVDGGYLKPRAKAPFFYALFDGLFKQTTYTTLDFGDYLSLVLLDSGHCSPIGGDQAAWLEKTLKERVDHPNVLVVNHVPAYPSARKMEGEKGKEGTGEPNRKHWVPLFEKYRVPVVLEHHDHTFKRSKMLLDELEDSNGVLYLGDGSWGRLRPPQKPEKLPFMAAVNQSYHLSLHRIQGEERFHLALDEFGRVMDVCRTAQRKRGSTPASG